MHKKKYGLLALLLALAMIVSACGGASQTGTQQPQTNQSTGEQQASGEKVDLLMGTGSQGGTYYPLGQEMANVWNRNIENVNVTATESGASVENLAKIGNDEFDLGMSVHIPALSAYNGTGDFEGRKIENFAFVGFIYPEVLQIITREGTGINTIADLKGKRVAIGPPGSGTQSIAKAVLAAYGITDADYTAYQEGFGDAKAKLQDGTIDASFGILGLPNAEIDELQVAVKDVKFLEITGEELKKIQEESGYQPFTIPAGSYEWLDKDVSTVSAYAILVANTNTVSDDIAYELAKVMYEKASENTHPQARHMTPENALLGSEGLPIHPGAERYFKEAGIMN